jgi:DNA-directed RNA polymerase specialized sigma24 family protein
MLVYPAVRAAAVGRGRAARIGAQDCLTLGVACMDDAEIQPPGSQARALHPHALPLPGDESLYPDLLADRVRTGRTHSEQTAALEQLWQHYGRAVAEQVRSRFRATVGPDFVDEAFGLLWLTLTAGMYDWRRGQFEAWWRTVLHNTATSSWRKSRHTTALMDDHESVGATDPSSAEDALDNLFDKLSEFRLALDGLPQEGLRAQVNYFAVLLLELRRALVARLRMQNLLPNLAELLPDWKGVADSGVIEHLFPWRAEEELLAFRDDLADLREIWGRLCPLVDAPPHDLRAELMCAQIVSKAGTPLTRDVWYNWKRHLKQKLRELGFPGKWDDLF